MEHARVSGAHRGARARYVRGRQTLTAEVGQRARDNGRNERAAWLAEVDALGHGTHARNEGDSTTGQRSQAVAHTWRGATGSSIAVGEVEFSYSYSCTLCPALGYVWLIQSWTARAHPRSPQLPQRDPQQSGHLHVPLDLAPASSTGAGSVQPPCTPVCEEPTAREVIGCCRRRRFASGASHLGLTKRSSAIDGELWTMASYRLSSRMFMVQFLRRGRPTRSVNEQV